jgi:hypothetical protein
LIGAATFRPLVIRFSIQLCFSIVFLVFTFLRSLHFTAAWYFWGRIFPSRFCSPSRSAPGLPVKFHCSSGFLVRVPVFDSPVVATASVFLFLLHKFQRPGQQCLVCCSRSILSVRWIKNSLFAAYVSPSNPEVPVQLGLLNALACLGTPGFHFRSSTSSGGLVSTASFHPLTISCSSDPSVS